MDLTFLLIGHTGFLGSAFKRYFEQNGIEYTGVNTDNYSQYVGASADVLINANGNSKKYLAREEPCRDFQLNVNTTLDSLHDFEFEQYVYVSSVDVYSNHSDPAENREASNIEVEDLSNYGFDKHMAEQIVKKYADDWLIIRPGGMVGQGLYKNSVYDLLHRDRLWVDPGSKYQYISTDEVARLVIEMIEHEYSREIFNINGRKLVSIREIGEELLDLNLEEFEIDGKQETYHINVDKLSEQFSIKTSREYVIDYLSSIDQLATGETAS